MIWGSLLSVRKIANEGIWKNDLFQGKGEIYKTPEFFMEKCNFGNFD